MIVVLEKSSKKLSIIGIQHYDFDVYQVFIFINLLVFEKIEISSKKFEIFGKMKIIFVSDTGSSNLQRGERDPLEKKQQYVPV